MDISLGNQSTSAQLANVTMIECLDNQTANNGGEDFVCVGENTGEEEKCYAQEYFSFNYAIVGTLFQSIIFFVGVLGNLLVCAVVRRMRHMHSTTNCYLVRP